MQTTQKAHKHVLETKLTDADIMADVLLHKFPQLHAQ